MRDHVNEILAGLEGDNAQDAENNAEILAGNMEYGMQKKECKAAKKKKEGQDMFSLKEDEEASQVSTNVRRVDQMKRLASLKHI